MGSPGVTPQVRAELWPRHLALVREEGQLCFSGREWMGFGCMGFGGHVGKRNQPLQEAAPPTPFHLGVSRVTAASHLPCWFVLMFPDQC